MENALCAKEVVQVFMILGGSTKELYTHLSVKHDTKAQID